MQTSDAIHSEEDLQIFMAYKFCTAADNPTAVETCEAIRAHYEGDPDRGTNKCGWCHEYVRQRGENRHNWISEVGWWSGYADRERF